MRTYSKRSSYFFLVLIFVLTLWYLVDRSFATTANMQTISVESDRQKGEVLVRTLPVTEVLGPLAPVALSPFFGIACLSGTSILCSKGVLPENSFLMGSDVLNSGAVFLAFLVLALATSIPKLTTASKVFAEVTDQLETYAGIISYAVILLLAGEGQGPEQEAVVYSAGIFTFTQQTLLAAVAAVNIIVISTVRFFFELLALLSPVPALDAIFECANKAVAAALAFIYALNPWLAFVINVFIFLFCLLMFNWINRRIKYLKAILLDPIMLGIKRKFFGSKADGQDAGAKRKLIRLGREIDYMIKCFPSREFGRIKKKALCHLVFNGNQLSLIKPRLFKPPVVEKLDKDQVDKEIKDGVLTYSIQIMGDSGKENCELLFGGAFKNDLEQIRAMLARLT
jgi:hypothetical protein